MGKAFKASVRYRHRLKAPTLGETCSECGGDVKIAVPAHPCAHGISASMHVIASIEDPAVIQKILTHLDDNAASSATALLPDCRASPTVGLFV